MKEVLFYKLCVFIEWGADKDVFVQISNKSGQTLTVAKTIAWSTNLQQRGKTFCIPPICLVLFATEVVWNGREKGETECGKYATKEVLLPNSVVNIARFVVIAGKIWHELLNAVNVAIFVTFLVFNGSSILTAFVDILLNILLMSKMFTIQMAIIVTLVKIFDKNVLKSLVIIAFIPKKLAF